MRPITLSIRAFGSYGEEKLIDFTKPRQNLFLITGDTGAGKTTIFDAIVFALYGEASSSGNVKDGTELQSQYVKPGVRPQVKLTFSENSGRGDELYTVTRTPQYLREKQRGEGMKKETGSVSLIMPDGSEFSGSRDETDRKLEEIIGLSKPQFMQVAMIAQGEFMDLLRTSSADRKAIFRRLFGTELYDGIVGELRKRLDVKKRELARIGTEYKTVAEGVMIPEGDEDAAQIAEVKRRLADSERASISDMEQFSQLLAKMCGKLESDLKDGAEQLEKSEKLRDERRDEYMNAKELGVHFDRLEEAKKQLDACAAREPEMKKAAELSALIGRAYEIKAVYELYAAADRLHRETEKKLGEQTALLPSLEQNCTDALAARNAARTELDVKSTSYAKTEERTAKQLEILKRLTAARREAEAAKAEHSRDMNAETAAKQKLGELADKEKQWRTRADELSYCGERLVKLNGRKELLAAASASLEGRRTAQKELEKQRGAYEAAAKEYEDIRGRHAAARAENDRLHQMYFDAQAGFIAKEKLREGQPCPVCGSIDHPSPCKLSQEHSSITREMIDRSAENVSALMKQQEQSSQRSGAEGAALKEKELRLDEASQRLTADIVKLTGETVTDERAAERQIKEYKRQLDIDDKQLRADIDEQERLKNDLKKSEELRTKLEKAAEDASERAAASKLKLAAQNEKVVGLEQQCGGEDETELKKALAAAAGALKNAQQAAENADRGLTDARSRLDNCRALIGRYEKELPALKDDRAQKNADYESVMAAKGLSELDWKTAAGEHKLDETEQIAEKIRGHEQQKTAAEATVKNETQYIDGRKRPVVEELEAAYNTAQSELTLRKRTLEQLGEYSRIDRRAERLLSPKLEERVAIKEQFSTLDGLYRRLSSKEMDIETYVQRYYLERILQAANKRLLDMSAGQFELRLCSKEDIDSLDKRSGHGLDLMVYSTVTGRKREVRTLSGGESFIAALSLALGMADRIGEHSSSINLDIMFIDEGFGSLDDHSRSQAVKVLQQMASGKKLIGIISHVTELKQELDDQLIVTKDECGSDVRWQLS